MINELGEDKFLFGTDYPMWDPKEELGRFLKLPLSHEQQEKILWNNFENLFIK
ncbi:MAG: amidohydrolase family protein [Oscillospiraceae bacterium]